jgi:putative intracellular protease/amidase
VKIIWQPELAHPYNVLKPYTSITVASPRGGEAPLDQASVEAFKEDKISQDFLKTEEKVYKDTQVLSAFVGHASEFDAIFFVGGHGRESKERKRGCEQRLTKTCRNSDVGPR